jgi:predicted alpha/beta hydrolase family esterase
MFWCLTDFRQMAEVFAELLRQFLNNGYDVNLLELVGHSLGGQTVGKVSRHLKLISHNKYEIPFIVALDPAGKSM